jgi:hypothetical protein
MSITTAITLLSVLACLLAMSLSLGRERRSRQSLEARVSAQIERIAGTERAFAALLDCSRTIGRRLVEQDLARRALQRELDKLANQDDTQLAVQHAMKLLDSGLDARNVVSICDLSEGEIELLESLARYQRAA